MKIVILGLSITSSWGNGHATTYRALVRGLVKRGHEVLFLERDQPWYASNRDLPNPPFGRTKLYTGLADLKDRFGADIADADLVMVGSYVPEGVPVGEWAISQARCPVAFYDIDTPVTLAKLESGDTEYLSDALIPQYDLYLSFTGGPILQRLQEHYGAQRARVLYCSVDDTQYYPEERSKKWDLGYLGTYSDDRQPVLQKLMLTAASQWGAGRFAVAGPLYPKSTEWPANVERMEHLPPSEHRFFYNSQRFTLNVTRADMVAAGYSPSVRLFEAAACGVPIITDYWDGLDSLFTIDREILVSHSADQTLQYLQDLSTAELAEIGKRARARVLDEHTSDKRAEQLEAYIDEVAGKSTSVNTSARNTSA